MCCHIYTSQFYLFPKHEHDGVTRGSAAQLTVEAEVMTQTRAIVTGEQTKELGGRNGMTPRDKAGALPQLNPFLSLSFFSHNIFQSNPTIISTS